MHYIYDYEGGMYTMVDPYTDRTYLTDLKSVPPELRFELSEPDKIFWRIVRPFHYRDPVQCIQWHRKQQEKITGVFSGFIDEHPDLIKKCEEEWQKRT
jgi:hypothetical protein